VLTPPVSPEVPAADCPPAALEVPALPGPVPAVVPGLPAPLSLQSGRGGCGLRQPVGPPEPLVVQATAPANNAALTQSSNPNRRRSS